jgi:hypothetical protein
MTKQVLATFTDANPVAAKKDFTPTVIWGGAVIGKPSVSVKLVSRNATASTWNVVGKAKYAQAGSYTLHVGVSDVDGSRVDTSNTTIEVAAALTAEGVVASSPNVPVLTPTDLRPIVDEAIARWASAGLDAATVARLTQIEFILADLPGAYLGEAEGNRIYLDRDAANHGWFIDPTPTVDEEFALPTGADQLHAIDSRAVDRIDLLTVVEHELGHIAGFDDLDAANDLMSGVLGVGIRREVLL